MKVAKQTTTALCPDCEEDVDLGSSPKLGQKVTCPFCEADLKVTSVRPLRLSWDDDDMDYDEAWDDDSDW